MKLLSALGEAIAAALPKARPPLSEDALDALAYIQRVNARAAAARADRARIFDELLGGGRWIPRRGPGWLAPKPRTRW